MPKRNAPEFYWDEKRKRYRKRIKDKATGKWVSVYGKTKDECRSNAKRRAAELAEAARVKEIPFVFEYAAKWFELYTAEVGEKRKDDYRKLYHALTFLNETRSLIVITNRELSTWSNGAEDTHMVETLVSRLTAGS